MRRSLDRRGVFFSSSTARGIRTPRPCGRTRWVGQDSNLRLRGFQPRALSLSYRHSINAFRSRSQNAAWANPGVDARRTAGQRRPRETRIQVYGVQRISLWPRPAFNRERVAMTNMTMSPTTLARHDSRLARSQCPARSRTHKCRDFGTIARRPGARDPRAVSTRRNRAAQWHRDIRPTKKPRRSFDRRGLVKPRSQPDQPVGSKTAPLARSPTRNRPSLCGIGATEPVAYSKGNRPGFAARGALHVACGSPPAMHRPCQVDPYDVMAELCTSEHRKSAKNGRNPRTFADPPQTHRSCQYADRPKSDTDKYTDV